MNGAMVQEIDLRVQQLTLDEQLWLLEKLAQHIRGKVDDTMRPIAENREEHSNGSPNHVRPEALQRANADRDQADTTADEVVSNFDLKADSPLYHDIQQIRERKAQGKLKFYSYEEVFGE